MHHEGPLATLEPILDLLSSIFIVTVVFLLPILSILLPIPVSLPLPHPLLFFIIIITVDLNSMLSLEFSYISGVPLPV